MNTHDHTGLSRGLVTDQGSQQRRVKPESSTRRTTFPRWKAMLPGKGIPMENTPEGALFPPIEWGRDGEQEKGKRPQKGQRGLKPLEEISLNLRFTPEQEGNNWGCSFTLNSKSGALCSHVSIVTLITWIGSRANSDLNNSFKNFLNQQGKEC